MGTSLCEFTLEFVVSASRREGLDGPIVSRHKYAGRHPLD
jgi:hypothetical protein